MLLDRFEFVPLILMIYLIKAKYKLQTELINTGTNLNLNQKYKDLYCTLHQTKTEYKLIIKML